MIQRTGLPRAEVELLRAIGRATTGSGTVRTSDLLLAVDRDGVIGPRAAQLLMSDLIAPWRRHLPLVRGEGNWGSQHGDPPADPEHTEVGLTPYGLLAVAAEDGLLGPVPLGLIDGSWYRGGQQPPYAPRAVLAALRHLDATDLNPAPPTGGTVSGDLTDLAAGRPARLTLSATVIFEARQRRSTELPEPPPGAEGGWFRYTGHRPGAGGDRVVVTEVPYGVTVDDATDELRRRLQSAKHDLPIRHYSDDLPRPTAHSPAPIVDICDHSSSSHGLQIVGMLRANPQAEAARDWVLSTPCLSRVVDALLPADIQTLVAEWHAADRSGLHALAELIEAP